MVRPLIYLLAFDALVCFVWWAAVSIFEVTAPDPKLKKIMLGLVVLINLVVVVVWFLSLFGILPINFTHGTLF